MAPIPFISEPDLYKYHYGGLKRFEGGGLNRFEGTIYQEGSGLADIFGSIARRAIPLLKKGALAAGKSLLRTGGDVLEDVMSGKSDFKASLKKRGKEGLKRTGKNVKDMVIDSLAKRQRGGGGIRKRTRSRCHHRQATITKDDIFTGVSKRGRRR